MGRELHTFLAEHIELRPARGLAASRWRLGTVGERWGRYFLGLGCLVALYYAAAHIGYAFQFAGPVAAIVWLPVGVGIAFLYFGGLHYWPGVVAGDLLVNNYSALPLGSALGQTFGNLLEVLVASALLRSLCPRESPMDSVSGVAKALAAIACGTAVSATIGSLSLRLGDVITTGSLAHVWRTWWLGDFCGALIVLPLALAWSHPPRRPWAPLRVLEGTLMVAAVAGLSEIALHTSRPLSYLVFPALIWAALRFGQRGATLAITITVGFTLWGTTHYVGPFAFHSISRSVLETQLYIAVAAISTLFLGALVSERRKFADRINASRSRLVQAADTERRRLERNLHDGAQPRLIALAAQLKQAREQSRVAPARTQGLFAAAQSELLLAIDELRAISHGIHPPVLEEFGLLPAVEAIAARSSVPIQVDLPRARLDKTAEVTAYYVVLEAMTNAQKYARASCVRVRGSLGRNLRLEISDDGTGGAAERMGGGLQGLRDRVEATGGKFTVDSPTGNGTRLGIEIPATPRDPTVAG